MDQVQGRGDSVVVMQQSGSSRGRDGRRLAQLGLAAVVAALATWQSPAGATPNPWPFDFDPQLADDPAALQLELNELGQGLPGLRDDEVVEVGLGPVSLWFFSELADALIRARDAGPGLMPAVVRTPVTCAAHDSFVFPSLLTSPALPGCNLIEDNIAALFDGNDKTCMQVEFPETYVFDHPPGHVDTNVVSSFEGLIGVAGEALRHLDYPAGLIPDDFFTKLRPIIAKLRHGRLVQQLDDRLAGYGNALQQLTTYATCFDGGAKTALEGTIATLTAELNQARQQLDQLYQDGLADAAADRAAMEALCRARQDLPHPALTDEERLLLSFYIGGIYWRARGAGLLAYPPDPEQGLLRRVLYVGYPYQLIANLTGGVDGDGVGNSILFDENWGWDEWWDMGTTPGSADKYSDLVGMTKRGKRGADTARPQIEGRGYDIRSLMGGAMQMGPCYYYAWEELFGFTLGEDLQDPYMWFIEWPTSIGEFCAGASLAEGLARTMLWGRPIPPDQCEVDPCADGSCGGGGGGVVGGGSATGGSGTSGGGVGAGTGAAVPGQDAGSGSTDGSCGCSTPGGGGSPSVVGLLLAGLLLRRRRR